MGFFCQTGLQAYFQMFHDSFLAIMFLFQPHPRLHGNPPAPASVFCPTTNVGSVTGSTTSPPVNARRRRVTDKEGPYCMGLPPRDDVGGVGRGGDDAFEETGQFVTRRDGVCFRVPVHIQNGDVPGAADEQHARIGGGKRHVAATQIRRLVLGGRGRGHGRRRPFNACAVEFQFVVHALSSNQGFG